jgi:hypothetical protein
VHEKVPEVLPPLAVVRKGVLESLLEERGRRALQQKLRRLRERYAVSVEESSEPLEAGE